jgi:DNA-directed RNA polymerase subunit RPC12/RpoP
MPLTCPNCASKFIVAGRLLLSGTDDGWVTRFYPKGIRFFTLIKSVPLCNGQLFHACADCGHAWSKVDALELRDLLERNGDDRTLAKLAQSKGGSPTPIAK